MRRYYCPQVSDPVKGWIDLPSLACLHQKDADAFAKAFAEDHKRITRTIRKPHGWSPDQ